MVKLQIKYSTEDEKERMIKIIEAGAVIKNISKPYKQGRFYRVYIDIK